MLTTRVKLIRDYFELSGGEAIREIKALSDSSKSQLASAIIRLNSIDPSEYDFELVDY